MQSTATISESERPAWMPSVYELATGTRQPAASANLLENARRAFKKVKSRSKGGRDKVAMAFVCTTGPRKGRKVSKASKCNEPIDQRKRFAMRKRMASFGKRYSLRARRTKRTNALSKRVAMMNKSLKRR